MVSYTIVRKGNFGAIYPVPIGKLASVLLEKLSYERPGKQFMPNPIWAVVKLYSVKTGRFPWGLLHIVKAIMEKWREYSGEEYTISFFPRRIIQHPAPSLRAYQNTAVQALLLNNGGILCMPTGSGKTITALEYVKLAIGEDKNMIAAVVVPTLDIKRMWERKIEELMMERVTVINYQSLNAPSIVAAADVIVFDECHHVAAKTLYNLAMKAQSSAIIVGLSATPTREDMQDMKMFGATGPIVYQVSRRELIDAGFLSDARVVYLRPRFDTRGDYTLDYAGTYEKHIVRNDNRNELIITSAEKYVMSGKKVLVLVTQIEHGQEVYNRIISSKKVFCHGTTDERFKDLSQFDVIVASNIFNEGIDLPELDVVILAAGGKSSIQLTQRVGRVLRLKKHQHPAVIVDFVDLGPRHLSAHYKKRRALLEADFEVDDEQSGEIV